MSVREITRAGWRRAVALVVVLALAAPAFTISASAAAPQQAPTDEQITWKELGAIAGVLTALLGLAWLAGLPARYRAAKAKATVENVRFEQVTPETIHIYYDLLSTEVWRRYTVKVQASADGGRSFGLAVRTVSGDVGSGISLGREKLIVWEAAADIPTDQPLDLKFRVTVKAMKQ